MDPLLSKEEKNMRDKILQHEFPFDEKAWGAMKTLLEEKGEKPAVGVPPAQQEPIPGPGKNLVWLILLFLSAGIGAASLFWPGGAENNMPTSGIMAPVDNPQNLKTTSTTTGAATVAATTHVPATNAQKQPSSMPGAETSSKSGVDKTNYTTAKVASFTPKAAASEIRLPAATLSAGADPERTLEQTPNVISQEQETYLPAGVQKQLDILFLPLLQTPALPFNSPLPVMVDSLTRPHKESPRAGKKREQGILLGMNVNAVDYNPMRYSILPHIGYFQSFRLNSTTRLQADLVLKYVTGYQLYVETRDITPLGASYSTLSTNSLIYLEMPVVIKRQLAGSHSFFTGIKPSLNYKIFSSGQNAGFNMDNTREYTSQSGVRYFDLGLVLGWEYRLHPRWALDVRYNQGLLDLSYDQFYRNNSTHLNSDLQLSLRYIFGK